MYTILQLTSKVYREYRKSADAVHTDHSPKTCEQEALRVWPLSSLASFCLFLTADKRCSSRSYSGRSGCPPSWWSCSWRSSPGSPWPTSMTTSWSVTVSASSACSPTSSEISIHDSLWTYSVQYGETEFRISTQMTRYSRSVSVTASQSYGFRSWVACLFVHCVHTKCCRSSDFLLFDFALGLERCSNTASCWIDSWTALELIGWWCNLIFWEDLDFSLKVTFCV